MVTIKGIDSFLDSILKKFFFFFLPVDIFLKRENRGWPRFLEWYYLSFLFFVLFFTQNSGFFSYLDNTLGTNAATDQQWTIAWLGLSPVAIFVFFRVFMKLFPIADQYKIQNKTIPYWILNAILAAIVLLSFSALFSVLLIFLFPVLVIDFFLFNHTRFSFVQLLFVFLVILLKFLPAKFERLPAIVWTIIRAILVLFFFGIAFAYILLIISTVQGLIGN